MSQSKKPRQRDRRQFIQQSCKTVRRRSITKPAGRSFVLGRRRTLCRSYGITCGLGRLIRHLAEIDGLRISEQARQGGMGEQKVEKGAGVAAAYPRMPRSS